MTTYASVIKALEKSGNVQSVSMKSLRVVEGKKRLGSDVRRKISDKLAEYGIAHLPTELPDGQDHWVLLYKRDSPGGVIIETFLRTSEDEDQIKAVQTLRKIRALIERA